MAAASWMCPTPSSEPGRAWKGNTSTRMPLRLANRARLRRAKKLEDGRKDCAKLSVSSASLRKRSAVVTRTNSALWALSVGPILGLRTNAVRITVETPHVGELIYPDAGFARVYTRPAVSILSVATAAKWQPRHRRTV